MLTVTHCITMVSENNVILILSEQENNLIFHIRFKLTIMLPKNYMLFHYSSMTAKIIMVFWLIKYTNFYNPVAQYLTGILQMLHSGHLIPTQFGE